MSSFSNRKWVIFNVSEISSIDFSQVIENNEESLRKSRDNTLTFVKYDGDMPSSVSSLSTKSQEYSYSEILQIVSGTTAWND